MDAMREAIGRGELEAVIELGHDAVERGDADSVQVLAALLNRMPSDVAVDLRERVRAGFPALVAGMPAFAAAGEAELPPSSPIDALLRRAIDGDRAGALAQWRTTAAGGDRWHALAGGMIRTVPSRASLRRPLLVDRGEEWLATAPGSRGTIVVFTGMGDRVWMDLPVFDAWVAAAGYRGVYLRDRSRRLYTEGLSAEVDRAMLASRLREVVDTSPGETVFLGTSLGGFGALWWAAELGVRRTLAFAPPTSLDPRRLREIGEKRLPIYRRQVVAEGGIDLRDHLAARGHDGRIDLHYGETARIDRRHGEYLQGTRVHHHVLPGWPHHRMLPPLAAAGRLPAILRGAESD